MTNSIWSYEQQWFMAWLCTPEKGRKPKTQTALAKEMGVNRKTLSTWKQNPEFIKAVNKKMFTATKEFWGRIPEYLEAIISHAIDGKAHYAMVVKDFIIGSNQFSHLFKPEEQTGNTDTNKMTDQEIDNELMKLLRRKKTSNGKLITITEEARLN